MRLWSIHPKYLDSKGLIALWRESLLALHVLQDKTKGYKNHPQLIRFKNANSPLNSIALYLHYIFIESKERKYHFDSSKIPDFDLNLASHISVTNKQIEYEWLHFKSKVFHRDVHHYNKIKQIEIPQTNPIFSVIKGEIEDWEKIIDY